MFKLLLSEFCLLRLKLPLQSLVDIYWSMSLECVTKILIRNTEYEFKIHRNLKCENSNPYCTQKD